MFVYIPRHLGKIGVVSQMTDLLMEYAKTYGSSGASESFDYYYYYYTIDPVKNFIRMCLTNSGEPLDEGVQSYLVRLFYSVKGTPKVLDLMEKELGLEFIPDSTGRKYIYDDNKITYRLGEISTFNLQSFMEGQEKFLKALIYYHDLTALIDSAKLIITESLKTSISVDSWTYTSHEI